jgi:prepilin-type N-terminal cleavage/methylation domain-containing protein
MKNGFTLIEILSVLAIIFTLTSISVPLYRIIQKQHILENAAQKLAQDIRKSQEMAISARICEICTPQRVPPGYGIYLEQSSSSYIIYADINGNEFYNEGDAIVETISFERGIFIQSVNPSSLSINFRPPDPRIRIGNGSQTLTEVSIVISFSSDASKTKTIKVNKAGLIYVE